MSHIMSSAINIAERLRLGRLAERSRRADGEEAKLGNLRAGMTGIMSETGDIAANCHRKSLIRSMGLELEVIDENKMIMFELGYASEDITHQILLDSLQPGEILLREEEIPISWLTSNGTKVTGRPDIVICRAAESTVVPAGSDVNVDADVGSIIAHAGPMPHHVSRMVPILGLELKSVHSIWTARDVLFSGQPKMGNLAQTAHYMWKLGVPYKLIYKSYSQLGQSMSDWAVKFFPRQGEPNSQYVDYNNKGGVKGLKQFEIVYDIQIDEKGRVGYKLEQDTEWKRSIITIQDIERYYEYVSQMTEKKELGPRPMTIDAHGEKLNYKECAYCPAQPTCDKYETLGFVAWTEAIRNQADQLKQK